MLSADINDIRVSRDFKGVTFSDFKKTDVLKELLNSLVSSKIEPACYWSAELICAGHYGDLWEIILFFYSKFIHLGNPKIAIYLELRVNNFKEIVSTGYQSDELGMRNSKKIRHLFCEIMCVLCDAKRKHGFDDIKIRRDDFDMTQMTERLKAPTINYADDIFLKEDPRELLVSINELAYNVSADGKNIINACYWIEWIVEFENVCRQRKDLCKCERRGHMPVESKRQMDIIWIVWDVLLHEASNRSKIIVKTVNALLNLFALKYTARCNKKRKYLLYFVVSLLCEAVNMEDEIIRKSQHELVATVLTKIDMVYKQIKRNEVSPGMDYLFKDLKSTNLANTIEKLETMNTFGESFIPRI